MSANTSEASTEKALIYRRWWLLHQPKVVPLFTPEADGFALSQSAERLLASTLGEEAIYVLTLSEAAFHLPVYIGKSTNSLGRWRGGHVPGLNDPAKKLYSPWRNLLRPRRHQASIYALKTSDIKDAPLLGFPRTIGAVEYQLVSLATDFSPHLLNREGAPR